jgi:hypothetical protein
MNHSTSIRLFDGQIDTLRFTQLPYSLFGFAKNFGCDDKGGGAVSSSQDGKEHNTIDIDARSFITFLAGKPKSSISLWTVAIAYTARRNGLFV